MTKYAQQVAPASSGSGSLIGWVPTVGAAWQDCPNGYGGVGSFFKLDGNAFWNTNEWEMARIPTNSGNADGPVEGVFQPDGDDWIMSVFMRGQTDGQRYQLTLSGSSGNSWISLESGAGGFPGAVVATTTHGIAASNRGTHTIKLEATGTGFVGSLNGTPFISGTNATLAAGGHAGQGGRSVRFISLDANDTTASGPVITGPSGAAGAAGSTSSGAENSATGPTFSTSVALGVGYPTITGADASLFTIAALTSTSWRVDFLAAPNFEAPGDAGGNNVYDFTFNASATVSQTHARTVTNANEAPTFSGTISVPTLTAGAAMTPVSVSGLYGDPDSGDTAAYTAIGTWPSGVTANSSTGQISGTPAAAGTFASLQVRRTDSGSLAIDSNTFTITVVDPSTLTGTAIPDAAEATGDLGVAYSRVTSGELKTNNGTAHTSAPFEAFVNNATTGALIVKKTGLTSSGSTTAPTCTFTDAALPAVGTTVRVTWRRTDTGAEGTELLAVT